MKEVNVVDISFKDHSLRTLSLALKDYKKNGKSVKEFAEDYDCTVNYNDYGQILDISCNSESSKTMMKLKYE